ncbi:hypothetical protein BDW59DRAFT_99767 [Aspergillus cavernicola]|uniref:Uncharacterized protein n=1 Tax=Aspergillus cavernicola TaxID=176166 RepID=A0ABR4I5Y5_9EURO
MKVLRSNGICRLESRLLGVGRREAKQSIRCKTSTWTSAPFVMAQPRRGANCLSTDLLALGSFKLLNLSCLLPQSLLLLSVLLSGALLD